MVGWWSVLVVLKERVKKLEERVDELEESMEILGDSKTLENIRRGLEDLKAGRFKVYDDVDEYIAELEQTE
jgi:tetrahydromethanopterin S-methyltransferase subunit B